MIMATTVELIREDRLARVLFRSENGIQILGVDARDQLASVLDQLEMQTDCQVVVFEAEGRTFIAGADLKELRRLDARTAYSFAREGQKLMRRIERLKPVTIAAVHAACAGGGCEMALACDFRLGARSAKIGLPEVSLGLLPGWGGTVRAVRLLGGAAARRIILTGELLPADEAQALGLFDAVHEDEAFRDAVQARAALLLSRGPNALRRAKSLIQDLEAKAVGRKFRREARRFAACYETAEPAEGTLAFLEKRAPAWKAATPG
jgi:enoyl-CoA hydratase